MQSQIFFKTSKTTFNIDQQGKKVQGKDGMIGVDGVDGVAVNF